MTSVLLCGGWEEASMGGKGDMLEAVVTIQVNMIRHQNKALEPRYLRELVQVTVTSDFSRKLTSRSKHVTAKVLPNQRYWDFFLLLFASVLILIVIEVLWFMQRSASLKEDFLLLVC